MQTCKLFQLDSEEEKQSESLCFPCEKHGYCVEIITVTAVMKAVEATKALRLSFLKEPYRKKKKTPFKRVFHSAKGALYAGDDTPIC